MKKTGCLVSFIREDTLTVFLISQNFSFIKLGAFERKDNYFRKLKKINIFT